ncbi:MAG TPA: hypothetical protein VFO07_04585 [Roseiflexaceae bacterium]|nr:hypothetical protein [Roseiflexaceae bacterium]
MITSRWTLRLALLLALLLAGSLGINRAAARPIDEERAAVKVVIMPVASPDSLTYTIRALNRGDSWAHYAKIAVPYDATALKLIDVQFSGAPAWVTQTGPGSFDIRTERLNSNGGATTATVRFAALKPGAQLMERLTYSWADSIGGSSGRSNLPLTVAEAEPYATLTHRQAGTDHFFSGKVFVPGEPVVFWYHLPDGSIVPTEVKNGVIVAADSTDAKDKGSDYALADADGAIDLEFSTGHLAAGQYTMVARGDISGITAVGECRLH